MDVSRNFFIMSRIPRGVPDFGFHKRYINLRNASICVAQCTELIHSPLGFNSFTMTNVLNNTTVTVRSNYILTGRVACHAKTLSCIS